MVVTAKTSATESGGYVVGFVVDPEDWNITEERLLANQGSVSRKWWETSRVPAHTSLNMLYYINEGRSGPRWISPGTFWLITQGDKAAFVTITVEWDVTFQGATLENPQDGRHLVNNVPLWSSPGHEYFVDGKGGTSNMRTKAFSWMPAATGSRFYWYRLEYPVDVEYFEGSGDTGTNIMFFGMFDATANAMYWSQDPIYGQDKTKWQSNLTARVLLPSGCRWLFYGASPDTTMKADFRITSALYYGLSQCGTSSGEIEEKTPWQSSIAISKQSSTLSRDVLMELINGLRTLTATVGILPTTPPSGSVTDLGPEKLLVLPTESRLSRNSSVTDFSRLDSPIDELETG
jgi:hypothetical protein